MSAWCGNCRFFVVGSTVAFPDADGMCRRYAPQCAVVGCAKNGWQAFPPMAASQWCGEHQQITVGATNKRSRDLGALFEVRSVAA